MIIVIINVFFFIFQFVIVIKKLYRIAANKIHYFNQFSDRYFKVLPTYILSKQHRKMRLRPYLLSSTTNIIDGRFLAVIAVL